MSIISNVFHKIFGGHARPAPPPEHLPPPVEHPLDKVDPLPTPVPEPTGARPAPRAQRQWQDEVIYSIMTDRFRNGDITNDSGCDRSNADRFHGGDWQGVIDKLDDLKNLGVTTLWISPVTMNDTSVKTPWGIDGYHGYWPHDFEKTEPHFGSLEKLKELVAKAHHREMNVMIDVVLNHTGYDHPWAHDNEHYNWFHHGGSGPEQGELFNLPDLAQENPTVSKYLIDVSQRWAREVGADGYRLDALMHMPASFEKDFTHAMKDAQGKNFILLGEAYNGDPQSVANFQSRADCDGVFDFPLCNTVRNVIGLDETKDLFSRWKQAESLLPAFPGESYRLKHVGWGGARQFHDLFAQDGVYKDSRNLATMVENHDMPRFMTLAGPNAREKFKLGLLFEFCARGIPCVYYGAEDGMGASMSDMRADKRDGADAEMRDYIQKLASMRHGSVALRRGEQKELSYDEAVYAFAREAPQETVVVSVNVSGKEQMRKLQLPGTPGKRGFALQDLLSGEMRNIPNRAYEVSMPALQARVYRVTPLD